MYVVKIMIWINNFKVVLRSLIKKSNIFNPTRAVCGNYCQVMTSRIVQKKQYTDPIYKY